MHSDSFSTNASSIIPMPSCNSKELSKKKRGNRSAKLKQCKLDARREQWLSHLKKKEALGETDTGKSAGPMLHVNPAREERSAENLEIKSRGEKEMDDGSMQHYSDSESPANSPASHLSSVLGGNGSGTIFTGSSRSSSSSGSGGYCSRSVSDEDEEVDDDGCLDDWEAMADALAATDEKHVDQNVVSDSALKDKKSISIESCPDDTRPPVSVLDASKSDSENGASVQRATVNCRAWRPDDAFRPQCLPNLSKQYTFPMNSDRHYGCGGSVWGRKNVVSAPTSCPICFEDLDLTDSSFLPCPCGFRLCLFCHKRILEDDGRCPGCRKHYDHDLPESEATFDGNNLSFRLARSCSMITRS